jgi:hypothetical protein
MPPLRVETLPSKRSRTSEAASSPEVNVTITTSYEPGSNPARVKVFL